MPVFSTKSAKDGNPGNTAAYTGPLAGVVDK
jgi:hypothetical protein